MQKLLVLYAIIVTLLAVAMTYNTARLVDAEAKELEAASNYIKTLNLE